MNRVLTAKRICFRDASGTVDIKISYKKRQKARHFRLETGSKTKAAPVHSSGTSKRHLVFSEPQLAFELCLEGGTETDDGTIGCTDDGTRNAVALLNRKMHGSCPVVNRPPISPFLSRTTQRPLASRPTRNRLCSD